MFTRRFALLIVLIMGFTWLLAACGSETAPESEVAASDHDETAEHHEEDEDDHSHEADVEEHEEDHDHTLTTHDPIDGAETIEVVAKEWGFEPASIHLHEGEAVNIVLINEGTLEHEVELDAFGFHLHTLPGETVEGGFVPDQTGEFEFACFVPGHYDAGMVGEVVVEHAH